MNPAKLQTVIAQTSRCPWCGGIGCREHFDLYKLDPFAPPMPPWVQAEAPSAISGALPFPWSELSGDELDLELTR